MSLKSKGIDAERDLVHKFHVLGWMACRIAGSGSTKYPSPDVIAGKNGRTIAVECKRCSTKAQYFKSKEVKELNEFCAVFGAEPWVAVKFDRQDWKFYLIGSLKETGMNYVVKEKQEGKKLEKITSSS